MGKNDLVWLRCQGRVRGLSLQGPPDTVSDAKQDKAGNNMEGGGSCALHVNNQGEEGTHPHKKPGVGAKPKPQKAGTRVGEAEWQEGNRLLEG